MLSRKEKYIMELRFGFKEENFFEAPEAERAVPEVKFWIGENIWMLKRHFV